MRGGDTAAGPQMRCGPVRRDEGLYIQPEVLLVATAGGGAAAAGDTTDEEEVRRRDLCVMG
eukprot:COSAG01_NODE_7798_length_3052_cov_4.491026_2_plen_61_part_00